MEEVGRAERTLDIVEVVAVRVGIERASQIARHESGAIMVFCFCKGDGSFPADSKRALLDCARASQERAARYKVGAQGAAVVSCCRYDVGARTARQASPCAGLGA